MIFYLDELENLIEWADGADVDLILEPFACNYYGSPVGFDIYVGF